MSWCDTCPKPGLCCKTLSLSWLDDDGKSHRYTVWDDESKVVAEMLARRKLPFVPIEKRGICVDKNTGRTYSSYNYSCTKLQEDGRCGDNENRPQLCRDYQPGTDNLCVFAKK